MTALENVKVPLEISGVQDPTRLVRKHLKKWLLIVCCTICTIIRRRTTKSSNGRAIVKNPQIILADEPTGNLDKKAADTIKNLLLELKQDYGTTIIIATHSEGLAKDCNRNFLGIWFCYRKKSEK